MTDYEAALKCVQLCENMRLVPEDEKWDNKAPQVGDGTSYNQGVDICIGELRAFAEQLKTAPAQPSTADRATAPSPEGVGQGEVAPTAAPSHTDHPARVWDRTCPACIAAPMPEDRQLHAECERLRQKLSEAGVDYLHLRKECERFQSEIGRLRADAERYLNAIFKMADDGWLMHGSEGMSNTQRLVYEIAEEHPEYKRRVAINAADATRKARKER